LLPGIVIALLEAPGFSKLPEEHTFRWWATRISSGLAAFAQIAFFVRLLLPGESQSQVIKGRYL